MAVHHLEMESRADLQFSLKDFEDDVEMQVLAADAPVNAVITVEPATVVAGSKLQTVHVANAGAGLFSAKSAKVGAAYQVLQPQQSEAAMISNQSASGHGTTAGFTVLTELAPASSLQPVSAANSLPGEVQMDDEPVARGYHSRPVSGTLADMSGFAAPAYTAPDQSKQETLIGSAETTGKELGIDSSAARSHKSNRVVPLSPSAAGRSPRKSTFQDEAPGGSVMSHKYGLNMIRQVVGQTAAKSGWEGEMDLKQAEKRFRKEEQLRHKHVTRRYPTWVLVLTWVVALLWIGGCVWLILVFGLKFDRESTTDKAGALGEATIDKSWPISTRWLMAALFATVQDWALNKPFTVFVSTLVSLIVGEAAAIGIEFCADNAGCL